MKRPVIVVSVIVVVGAGLFLALRPSQPPSLPPVMVMPLPYSIPPPKLSAFDRWIPRKPSSNWAWRLKQTFMGRPKVCTLLATVVDCTGAVQWSLTNQPLPTPAFSDTNGLRIWLLGEAELGALDRRLRQAPGTEVLYVPRITTANGMQARLASLSVVGVAGTSAQVGLTMDFLPHVCRSTNDVTAVISHTEVNYGAGKTGILTNMAVAARVQVPEGFGVFLLEGPPAAPGKKRLGVLLSVKTASAGK
jgi:hypothetical protein